MKKHVKTSTLKQILHALYLSTALAVPSYVLAAEVGVGVGAGAKAGANAVDMRGNAGIGAGLNATGGSSSSVPGTGLGAGTASGPATVTGTGSMNRTPNTPSGSGTTGMGTATPTPGGMERQTTGPAPMPPGLDGNLNQNAQTLPDATRGLERADERMDMHGEEHSHATVNSKASIKAKKNSRIKPKTSAQ